jgi:hypothetical protein
MASSHQNEFVATSPRQMVDVASGAPGSGPSQTPGCRVSTDEKLKKRMSRNKKPLRTSMDAVSAMFSISLVLNVVVSTVLTCESVRKHRTHINEETHRHYLVRKDSAVWIMLADLCVAVQRVDAVICRSYVTVVLYFMIALARSPKREYVCRSQMLMTYLIGSNIGSEFGSILANYYLGRHDWVEQTMFGLTLYTLVCYLFFQWIKSDGEVKKRDDDGKEMQDRRCVCDGLTIC